MKRDAKLVNTTSNTAKEILGQTGTLQQLENGRWLFATDNGKTLQTSPAKEGTQLGSLNHPNCKSVHFETRSGSCYDFELVDATRIYGY